MTDSTLWCMHVPGPDEVYAAPSREAAQQMCDNYNATLRRFWDRFPRCKAPGDEEALIAVVAPWPWSAEAHAEAVTRSAERYRPEGEP